MNYRNQKAKIATTVEHKQKKSDRPTRQSLQRLVRFAFLVLEVCRAHRNALPCFLINIEQDILRCFQRAGIDPLAASIPRLAALRIFDRFYRNAGLPANGTQFKVLARYYLRSDGGF